VGRGGYRCVGRGRGVWFNFCGSRGLYLYNCSFLWFSLDLDFFNLHELVFGQLWVSFVMMRVRSLDATARASLRAVQAGRKLRAACDGSFSRNVAAALQRADRSTPASFVHPASGPARALAAMHIRGNDSCTSICCWCVLEQWAACAHNFTLHHHRTNTRETQHSRRLRPRAQARTRLRQLRRRCLE